MSTGTPDPQSAGRMCAEESGGVRHRQQPEPKAIRFSRAPPHGDTSDNPTPAQTSHTQTLYAQTICAQTVSAQTFHR